MLAKFSWTAFFALVAFIAAGLFLPSRYHIERNIKIERPASLVFSIVNNYRHFNQWSPWATRDPAAVYQFSGPESGPGARLAWSGDPRMVGSGYQEITRSDPFELVEVQLVFEGQGSARSRFRIQESGGATDLTWSFDTDVTEGRGPLDSLMGKYFGLFLERWVGQDYAQGLAALKIYAESLPATDFAGADIELVDAQPVNILFVSGNTSQAPEDVASALEDAFGEINKFIRKNSIQMSGQPMAITRAWDENGYSFDAALPVETLPESTDGRVQAGQSPAGRAVRLTHRGPYTQMLSAYDQLAAYMAANGLKEGKVSWEHYVSDPTVTPPEQLVTHVYFLLEQ